MCLMSQVELLAIMLQMNTSLNYCKSPFDFPALSPSDEQGSNRKVTLNPIPCSNNQREVAEIFQRILFQRISAIFVRRRGGWQIRLLKQQTVSLGGNIVGGRRNLARSQFRGQTLGGGNTCCVNTRDPVASAEIQIGKCVHTNTQIH